MACNLKTTKLLDCVLIGVCVFFGVNRVHFFQHISVVGYHTVRFGNLAIKDK